MRLAGLQLVDEALGHGAEGHRVDIEAGDVGAQDRIVGKRLLQRRAERVGLAAEAHAADHLALVAEQIFGDVPALVHLADDLVLRHLHVVEEGLAEGRIAGDEQDRPGRDAGARHVEQEEADPLMLGRGGIGADQAEDPVGLVGIAGPDLLAVDQPMIALVLAFGLQAGEVGAGARLGIALAPAYLAAGDLGQIMLLLRLAAIFEQGRAEHRDAEAHQRIAGADPRHLLLQYLGLGRRQPAAAIFDRPIGHGPAARGHDLHPLFLRVALEDGIAAAPAGVAFVAHRLAHLGRAVRLEPRPCLGPEAFVAHGSLSFT